MIEGVVAVIFVTRNTLYTSIINYLQLIGEPLTDEESKVIYEFTDNVDVFMNPRNNMLLLKLPFLHLLPGLYREEFQKARGSLDTIAQKYFYDCKVKAYTLNFF